MSVVVTYDVAPNHLAKIVGMNFGILNTDEMRRIAVTQIDDSSIYCRGVPTPRGVLDHRLGTVDRRHSCGTCHCDARSCNGHWGIIELPLPVVHVAFVEIVRKVLSIVCISCSRLRLSNEELAKWPVEHLQSASSRKARLTNIYSTCRARKICPHCSSPAPMYMQTPMCTIEVDWSGVSDKLFSPTRSGPVWSMSHSTHALCTKL